MLIVKLTQNQVAMIDEVDKDLLELNWCAFLCRDYAGGGQFVAKRAYRLGGKQITILLHRVILGRMLGYTLSSVELVDHIDRNTLNNCRGNLRLATHSQNQQNKTKQANNTSGYKGVYFDKRWGTWYTRIQLNGKTTNLGTFDSAIKAAKAYDMAAKELHGEFAVLNFPDEV